MGASDGLSKGKKKGGGWMPSRSTVKYGAVALAVAGLALLVQNWHTFSFSVTSAKREEANQAFMNGNLFFHQGDLSNAIQQYRTAVRANPFNEHAWTNLGNALSTVLPNTEGQQRKAVYKEAVNAYNQATSVAPKFVEAHFNLGVLQHSVERLDLAIPPYLRAVELDPAHYDAWSNLGSARHKIGDINGAVNAYQSAIEIVEQLSEEAVPAEMKSMLFYLLGTALTTLPAGRCLDAPCSEHAANKFRQALRLNENNEEARHALSALVSDPNMTGASAAYIKSLFDEYADSFDSALVAGLGYKAPELLRQAVGRFADKKSLKFNRVLDAGCGTGLCGPLFRNISETLVGVDLSEPMVEKARVRGVYDELYVGDIGETLDAYRQSGELFRALDLVVAADVFVYMGDLNDMFKKVSTALRKEGLFAFTLERLDPQSKGAKDSAAAEAEVTKDDLSKGWKLRFSGRFAHTRDYVTKLAKTYNFRVVQHDNIVPRKDNGVDIPGHLVLLELTK